MKEQLKYLLDKPEGIDLTDGKSQEKLAVAISEHIIETDTKDNEGVLPRIIGIEGTWGSGKSNVVKMVENELKSHPKDKLQYHFYYYNAWGNQEDLQRRAFLEQMTGALIEDGILTGKVKLKNGGRGKKYTWKKGLRMLLAHKIEKRSESFSIISIFRSIALILIFIGSIIPFLPKICAFGKFFSMTGVILLIIILFYKAYKNELFSYFWNVLTDGIEYRRSLDIVCEDDPTVADFKMWMKTVSDSMDQKLIVIFDDMDRLSADKVRQLWSSIHTFFAQETYKNIWVMIPYDRETIDSVFGGVESAANTSDRDRSNMSQYFINKTFSITFCVPKPIITDYDVVFSSFFKKAFEETDDPDCFKEQEAVISQLYRRKNREPNIRNIIIFINELVTLRKIWGEEYSIVNMAIYLLNKSELEKDPINTLLSEVFLNDFNGLIKRDDDLLNEIASFIYGVDKSKALQIPMKGYIENCIGGIEGHDINTYSGKKDFDAMLSEVLADINTDNLPKMVDILNELEKSNESISNTWKTIADRIINERIDAIFELAVNQRFLSLISHVADKTKSELIEMWSSLAKLSGEKFKGGDYVRSIIKLKKVYGDSITIPMPVIKASAAQFIEALKVAKEDYPKYNLAASASDVENAFINDPNLGFNRFDLIRILKDTGFCEFKNLKNNIIGYIRGNKVEAGNVGGIYNTYRILSEPGSGTLAVPRSDTVRTIKNSLEKTGRVEERDGYIDVLAMIAVQSPQDFQAPMEKLQEVTSIIEYYIDADTLLLNGLKGCTVDYKNLVHIIVTLGVGKKMNNLLTVLQSYSIVKNTYGLTAQELLGYLNNWSDELVSWINVNGDDIRKAIHDSNFHKDIVLVDNALSTAVRQSLKK